MSPLARLIAWRYLFFSRERFVGLLALVAGSGIALGVWSLIVVYGVMQGFQTELNKRWIGLNAHLTVSNLALQGKVYETFLTTLKQWPEIASVTPYVDGEVIVRTAARNSEGAMAAKLRGIGKLTPAFLERAQIYPKEADSFSLMGGEELFSSLGVHPDFHDSLTLIYPFGEIGPSGDYVPTQKTFLVSHVFRTGLYEWDAYRILVGLADAKALLGDQAESGVLIQLADLSRLEKAKEKIGRILPAGAKLQSFAEQNRRLFSALKRERLAMMLILILFAVIASFSVVGLLLMFIDAKRRDLAILRAIGLPPGGAGTLFLNLGGCLGALGSAGGGALGLATCWVLRRYPIHLPSTYYLDYLPVQIQWGPVAMTLATGFFLAILSAWYPVRVASRLEVLPMLREE